jgi:long-chain fatty acid transport protein
MLAREPDASAVAHNPALLTRLPGRRVMVGLTAIATSGHVDWSAQGRSGRSPVKRLVSPVPHAYYTHQINDDWFVGLGQFSRFGLGIRYPEDWPGRFNIHDGSTLTASLNPVVAWKATGRLSLAAGAELLYATLDMRKRIGVPVAPGVSFEVDSDIRDADDLALGFNLAAHYRLGDRWAVGAQYRSRVHVQAEGSVSFAYAGPDLPPLLAAFRQSFVNGRIRADVTLPDSLAAGLAFSPSQTVSLEAAAIWTRWSAYDSLDLQLPEPMGVSVNPTRWRDAWRLAIGLEHQVLDWLTWRVGYNWEESPMTEQYEDYTIPTDGRRTYTFGLGLHNESWTVDVAYMYVNCRPRSYNDNPVLAGGVGTLASTGIITAHELALTVGFNF